MIKFKALHFEITNKCNLRCKHCYNIDYLNGAKDDLSLNDVKKIIDSGAGLGCRDFGLSGGEPFMRSDIIEIIDYCPGPVHILTNGLLITAKHLDEIKKMDKPVEFRISLDGLSTNKDLRGINYLDVIEKIKMILRYDFVVTVNTMITSKNVGELIEMCVLLNDLKIDRWRLDFIFSHGNAKENRFYLANGKYLFKIKELIKYYLEKEYNFQLDINKIFRSICYNGAKRAEYNLNSKPCSYQGSLTIRPNGDVSFCPSLSDTYGNILKESIEKIFNNPRLVSFRNIQLKDIEKCNKCKIKKICGGGCRADAFYVTNSFLKKDYLTCKIMKYYVKEIAPMIEKIKKTER